MTEDCIVEEIVVQSMVPDSVTTWDCFCGNSGISAMSRCPECGRFYIDSLDAEEESKVHEELERFIHTIDHKNGSKMDVVRYVNVLAYGMSHRYLIPPSVAKEAISLALENVVRNFDMYDPDEGDFASWVYGVVRNALYNSVRVSKAINRKQIPLGFTSDEGHHGNLEAEHFYAFGQEDEYPALDEIDRETEIKLRRAIAISILGDAVYKVALDEVIEGGVVGWQTRVSSRLGMSVQTISARVKRARKKLEGVM